MKIVRLKSTLKDQEGHFYHPGVYREDRPGGIPAAIMLEVAAGVSYVEVEEVGGVPKTARVKVPAKVGTVEIDQDLGSEESTEDNSNDTPNEGLKPDLAIAPRDTSKVAAEAVRPRGRRQTLA